MQTAAALVCDRMKPGIPLKNRCCHPVYDDVSSVKAQISVGVSGGVRVAAQDDMAEGIGAIPCPKTGVPGAQGPH